MRFAVFSPDDMAKGLRVYCYARRPQNLIMQIRGARATVYRERRVDERKDGERERGDFYFLFWGVRALPILPVRTTNEMSDRRRNHNERFDNTRII